MSTFNRLLSIVYLSSVVFLCAAETSANSSKDIVLGIVQFETLAVTEKGGTHLPFIVVRVTDQQKKIESFGLSNDAGVLGMPLPPGNYCYDAFTKSGQSLRMNREQSERCFAVKAGEFTEVGVGIRQQ